MLCVDRVRLWYELPVPTWIPRLVSANQQNSSASRIECVKDAVRATFVLNSLLTHVVKLRTANCVGIRSGKRRTRILKHVHRGIDAILFFYRQAVPPFAEFIRKFDFPRHLFIMYLFTYIVKGIIPVEQRGPLCPRQ